MNETAEVGISEGQSIEKVYQNCKPMRLDDGPGDYVVARADEPFAYAFEVQGKLSSGWTTHIFEADEVPDDPAEAWTDDTRVRNVRPLYAGDELDG